MPAIIGMLKCLTSLGDKVTVKRKLKTAPANTKHQNQWWFIVRGEKQNFNSYSRSGSL